jgi:DtxR family Mn-dependent transcriptional regulator
MPSLTVENYLKAIYLLGIEGGTPVSLGDLARTLDLTPGTVTTMVQRLSRGTGLLTYHARQGATLTKSGEKAALKVLRRHRIIESFLVEIVGLDWSEVHDEAEHLEHAISDHLVEKLASLLSNPDYDPHGAPIPSPSGRMPQDHRISLADSRPGRLRVAALADGSPAFREFAQHRRLAPGAEIELLGVDAVADTVSLRVKARDSFGGTIHLGRNAASKIMVQSANTASLR